MTKRSAPPRHPKKEAHHASSDPVLAQDEKHEHEIEERLTAIYKDEAGNMPDLTTLEPERSRWWMYATAAGAGFVLMAIVAAWTGFAFFKPFRGFAGDGLLLQIEGPERVAVGRETTYFINYQNRASEPLSNVDLRVSFPPDFVVVGAEPVAEGEELQWFLNGIPVEGRGTVKIRGTFTGAIGTQTAVQVVGTYRPASFSTDFESLSTKLLTYDESVLSGIFVVPEKVLPGDTVTLRYSIQNTGAEPFKGVETRVTLPDGFELTSVTSTKLDGRTARFVVGALEPGATSTMALVGRFASGISGTVHVIAETGRVTKDGEFLPSLKTEAPFTVLAGDLSLKLVVNGTDVDTTVGYGGVLRFGLGYENTSPEDIADVRVRLIVEPVDPGYRGQLIDWGPATGFASGTKSGNTISWDRARIPELTKLSPREYGSFDLALRSLASKSGVDGLAFRVVGEATVASVGGTKVNRVVRSQPIVIRYMTDAEFSSSARYFSEEGAPFGSGPLPPQAGKATTYRVHWRVTKTFHEVNDLVVAAQLPKIAGWTGNVIAEAGTVSFDEATRTVRWTLNRMPKDVKEADAYFDLAITPSEADIGRFAQVLGETRFDAVDAVVNMPIFKIAPSLTTDLQNDEGAAGKGVVRRGS